MKATLQTKKTMGAIKIALFVATQVPALKGSKAWHQCNQLLNWINQYDENDSITITNDPAIIKLINESK